MTAQPSPDGDQDALYQLVDAWLDAEPGSQRRTELAAQLAASPAGRMWLAARETLIDGPATPDLVAATAADLRQVGPPRPERPRESPVHRAYFGTVVTLRQRAALLMALAAMAVAVAGVLLLPASGGGLTGSGAAGGELPVGSAVLWTAAVVLAGLAWVLWRRR